MTNVLNIIGALYLDDMVKGFIEKNKLIKKDGQMGEEVYLLTEDDGLSILLKNEESFVDDLYNEINYEKDDFVVTAVFVEGEYINYLNFPSSKEEFFKLYGEADGYNEIFKNYRWFFDGKVIVARFDNNITKKIQVQFRYNY